MEASSTTSPTPPGDVASPARHATRRALLKSFAGGAAGAAFLAAGWAVDAAAPRAALEVGSAPVVSNPARIVVVFGHPDDYEIFEGYYQTKHVPLELAMPYCSSIDSALGVSGTAGEKASFHRIAFLAFDSEEELVASMASVAGQAAFADIANFATGGATATIVSGVTTLKGGVSQAVPGDTTAVAAMNRTCGNSGSRRSVM